MALSLSSRFCPMPWRGKEKGNQIAENDEASVFVSLLLRYCIVINRGGSLVFSSIPELQEREAKARR